MISVIIPVYNEEGCIFSVIEDVTTQLQDVKEYEIIVVNDGSTDTTAHKLMGIGYSNLSIITHIENLGYGKSLYDGILAAKYDCIAILDGDASYSAKDILRLYEYYPRYDMIVGVRQGAEYRGRLFKRPARFFFSRLAEYASGTKIPDVNSGLRIFKKNIVLKFKDSLCLGFSFTTTLTLIFLLNHYYVKYIPVQYLKRRGRSKVRYLRDTLRTGQIIIEVILYYNPIKLFLLLSTVNLIFGILIGLVNCCIMHNNFISILSAFCIASFIPIFCMGLLAGQIKKIRDVK